MMNNYQEFNSDLQYDQIGIKNYMKHENDTINSKKWLLTNNTSLINDNLIKLPCNKKCIPCKKDSECLQCNDNVNMIMNNASKWNYIWIYDFYNAGRIMPSYDINENYIKNVLNK